MPDETPARILVLGGGGREHAIAWKLAHEAGVSEVIVAPGSAGIAAEPGVRTAAVDPTWIRPPWSTLAGALGVDLVVVGPEAPLSVGVADALAAAGIAVFGPGRAAARLETSKTFCHDVAEAAGVRMARARSFAGGEAQAALAFVRELDDAGAGVVLKADGLAAGKGVVVTASLEQAVALTPSFLGGQPSDGPALVVEERLSGLEASVIAICDGERAVALPVARDHKRLGDGDAGPNTGGMGAYSPLPDLDDAAVALVLETVHRPILAEMARRGTPFRGFLYAGLMLTAHGPVLLEINVRLGDPEAQVILPRVAADLAPLLLAAARGRLPGWLPSLVPALPGAAVGIVLAAAGYPEIPRRGDPIHGLEAARDAGALVFHAGTDGARGPRRRLRDERRPGAQRGRARRGPGRGPRGGRRGRGSRHVVRPAPPSRHRGRAAAPRHGGRPVIRRYTLPGMGAVWSEQARFERMLEVEIAVCRSQVRRGLVPTEALAVIEARAVVDVDRINEIEATTDHDVIAFVSQVAEVVGPEGRFLHLGLTSSDVVDTALALQLRAAGERLLADADDLLVALIARARREAGTVMMGRTHSVHAEPTTFGLKCAGWAFEVARGRERLALATAEIATGKISGPVGTYSHLGPDVEAEVLADLGLRVDPVSTQIVQRDRHAAFLAAIAILGGTLERLATEVRNLQHTEIAEVMEPFKRGQKGSSAMPHKRNPILSERIAGSRGSSAATPRPRSRTSRCGTSATSATAPRSA